MEIGIVAKTLAEIADFSDAAPLLIVYVVLEESRRPKWIVHYLFAYLSLCLLSILTGQILGMNNMWVYILLGFIELVLLYKYFRQITPVPRFLQILFWIVLGYYVIQSLFINSLL